MDLVFLLFVFFFLSHPDDVSSPPLLFFQPSESLSTSQSIAHRFLSEQWLYSPGMRSSAICFS
uniref:Secreted protein n=1 Tax=Mus musculus TaxID=10090 RepID=Q3UX89_MOUSE|nr:unnamed protein product [Mus musculus]